MLPPVPMAAFEHIVSQKFKTKKQLQEGGGGWGEGGGGGAKKDPLTEIMIIFF